MDDTIQKFQKMANEIIALQEEYNTMLHKQAFKNLSHEYNTLTRLLSVFECEAEYIRLVTRTKDFLNTDKRLTMIRGEFFKELFYKYGHHINMDVHVIIKHNILNKLMYLNDFYMMHKLYYNEMNHYYHRLKEFELDKTPDIRYDTDSLSRE